MIIKKIRQAILGKTNAEIFEEKETLFTKYIKEKYHCLINVRPILRGIKKQYLEGFNEEVDLVQFVCKTNHPKVKVIYISSVVHHDLLYEFIENPVPKFILKRITSD